MKKKLALLVACGVVLTFAACGSKEDKNETGATPSVTAEATAAPTEPATNDLKSEGELKMGNYHSEISYADEEANFAMTWKLNLAFAEDGTFTLTNDEGEEKGAGTYALADGVYTLDFGSDKKTTFIVKEDGDIQMTSDIYYGTASIALDSVSEIVLKYTGEAGAAVGDKPANGAGEADGETYTIAPGTYAGVYTKESPMAGTVNYEYTATLGEDGSFAYSVTFAMQDQVMEGASAEGTYQVAGNVLTFTDADGNVTEGTLTANDTLTISLLASSMAKDPYEVTLTATGAAASEVYSLSAGTYTGVYTKESPMAGTVNYNYTVVIGEDKTFSYSVTFDMGGETMEGSAAEGTYTVAANILTFTDADGNAVDGVIVADDTLTISLKASSMAKEPYEVTVTK